VSATVTPSSESPPAEERKAARRQSLPARAAYVAARRELARERDARRFELAEEMAARQPRIDIPREQGFVAPPPGDVAGPDEIVAEVNALIDSIGHEQLLARYALDRKKPYLANMFLGLGELTLDSPYLRFALGEELLHTVTAYLGVIPVLHFIDAWYSMAQDEGLMGSQLWHMDHDDVTLVKVWVHCSDIGPESGPLTALAATESAELADRIAYDMGTGYRVPDEELRDYAERGALVAFEGPAGTVDFVDTCRCFHMGSRLAPGTAPRRTFYCSYVTPYAFNFADHRDEAPFRGLAADAGTELERLVLGGA
jgi:hypothetical protein